MRGLPRTIAAVALLGLAGCPTVDLGEPAPDPGVCRPDLDYYREVIWPQVLAPAEPARSCVSQAGCHAANTGRSALRLETAVDADPTAHTRNYQVVTRFLNCATPLASSLITKPLATVDAHGGGDLYPNAMDPAVVAFEGWFAP